MGGCPATGGSDIMPIFEYKCRTCDHTFEALEFNSADTPSACPRCAAGELERLLSAAAVHTRVSVSAPLPCGGDGACCGSDLPRSAKPCMGGH
jgi:putative FmdB family regulatory protein